MKSMGAGLVLLAGLLLFAGPGLAEAPMTNEDVVSMVKAKLPADTIIMAVKAATPDFDTSADGLIKLQAAGVPSAVIDAVIAADSGGSSTPKQAASAQGVPVFGMASWNPEEVILVDGEEEISMRYITPQMRSAVRGLGWGGVAQYAVLRGTRASLRLKGKQPEFLVAVPSNAQPDAYLTIVTLAVRKNNSREIMVGGGYMSYSTGVATDRIITTASEQLADQSEAPDGFVSYRVRVASPLAPGEYAVVLYNSQVRTVGYFASGLDSYFDFGVD